MKKFYVILYSLLVITASSMQAMKDTPIVVTFDYAQHGRATCMLFKKMSSDRPPAALLSASPSPTADRVFNLENPFEIDIIIQRDDVEKKPLGIMVHTIRNFKYDCDFKQMNQATQQAASFGREHHIEYLYVAQEHQGKGYGKLFLDHADQYVQDKGCNFTSVYPTKAEIRPFYKKFGFKDLPNITTNHCFKDYMLKALTPEAANLLSE